jgi:Utp25, U3 small nucleolar RNA-associated SSU processome protein 25
MIVKTLEAMARDSYLVDSQAEAAEFAQVSEYAGHSDAARARSHFADGRAPLLLYTERAHFYHRHRLRGIRVSSVLCSCS